MSNPEPAWSIVCVEDGGSTPVIAFIRGLRNYRLQAKVVRKLRHLRDQTAEIGPDGIRRPQVATLRGPIKEHRKLGDKQLRVLFSWERDSKRILLFNGCRKKQDAVPETVIAEAERLRDAWLGRKSDVPLEKALNLAGLEVGR